MGRRRGGSEPSPRSKTDRKDELFKDGKTKLLKPIVVLINGLVFHFLHKVNQVFKCHHLEGQSPLCFYS